MAITTQTITANGDGTIFDYTGGAGVAIATGTFNQGLLELHASLDDTNYAPVRGDGIIREDGGFGFTLPACKLRWTLSDSINTPNIIVSVENV